MSANYIISREDWSLHRKGELDRQRHREKVKEAIKKNLADIVSEEGLITLLCRENKLLLFSGAGSTLRSTTTAHKIVRGTEAPGGL